MLSVTIWGAACSLKFIIPRNETATRISKSVTMLGYLDHGHLVNRANKVSFSQLHSQRENAF